MKKKLITLLVLLTLIIPIVSACNTDDTEEVKKEEDESIAVEVEKLKKDTISNQITLSGRVTPLKEMMIVPEFREDVEDIKVTLGKSVEKGDILFSTKNDEDIKEIKSPVDGKVAAINIKEGDLTPNAGPSMVIVADENPMTISINVTENLINQLFIGKNVEVNIDALEKEELKGIIASINTVPNERTGQYSGNIILDEELNNIKPGMTASVIINTDIKEDVLVVKSEAVLEDGERKVVFIEKDEKAVEKEVKTGMDTGFFTEIISGLKEGDNIIVKGQNYVEDGSEVETVRGEK